MKRNFTQFWVHFLGASSLVSGLMFCGVPALADSSVSQQSVTVGTSEQLDKYESFYKYNLPAGKRPDGIVGIGIAGSNDHVYVWFKDGTVSSGTSSQLEQYRKPYAYSLPTGKTPADIVGMGIAGSNDHVYAWYSDGTVSSGTSSQLDKYRKPYSYTLPEGKSPADIVGMGIAGSNDHVYVWFKDGTASSGTSEQLEKYRGLYKYSIPVFPLLKPEHILEMGIAGSNDRVYTWYYLPDSKAF